MEIILEENPLNPINEPMKKPEKQNPKESSSSSCNFERLYSELVEAQSDIESLDEGVQKFLAQYIENIINPNEIKNIAKIIKQNNTFQDKIYDSFQILLKEDLKENKEKVENGLKITKQIEAKTYQVARAKDIFRELNDMMHGDIISHQKEIKKISDEIKNIQQQVNDYEKEIETLNEENKKTYSEELNLLDTVMSFGKKLYTTYVTREEKKKEKNNLEIELNKLKEEKKEKDMKYQKILDDIRKNSEKAQTKFEEQKTEIELFLSMCPKIYEDYENIIKSLKSFYSSKLEIFNKLLLTQKEKKDNTNIIISSDELKEHLNCCDNNILQELFTNIEIIRNVHPYLTIPQTIDINNIIDVIESLNNQISFLINEETPQEKINSERENQMEELGIKIADVYYDKFIKHLFFDTLKVNTAEGKKKKEAEKKIKELKNKEEQLKQLQIKYISEQGSISSQNSQISNISSSSINEDIILIDKKKNYPSSPKNNTSFTSTSSSSSNNNINIKIKDKKNIDEKKRNKNSNINVIMEEDDSNSKSKSKSKTKSYNKIKDIKKDNKYENKIEKEKEKEKKDKEKEKEKENEITEKKGNYRQKSFKKKGKLSQNKKKKNKKNKKYDDDYYLDKSDDNVAYIDNDNNNEHIFSQMLGKEYESQNKNNDKGKEKQKKSKHFYESDTRNNKNQFNFPKNNFNCFEESSINDSLEKFDLNDLNFLTELGEELNKSEKGYGFGRKNNYRK